MSKRGRSTLLLLVPCVVSCAGDPEPAPRPFVFSAYAPVDGTITSARVDGAEYPLVPVGSGYTLMFEREYPNPAIAQQSGFMLVEFFQGANVHHTGYLRPGQCGRGGCSPDVCADGGSTLKAEEVNYGLNASFEPDDYICKKCVTDDDTIDLTCR